MRTTIHLHEKGVGILDELLGPQSAPLKAKNGASLIVPTFFGRLLTGGAIQPSVVIVMHMNDRVGLVHARTGRLRSSQVAHS